MNGLAISAQGLSKVYAPTLAVKVARALHMVPKPQDRGHGTGGRREKVQALRDVSLAIPKGQVVGVVGVNGSGKSTLLRILAGMARPTRGSVSVDGRVTSILDISTGLVPDLTGRACISYMGSLYGMSRVEQENKQKEILDFADIGRFADYPVRTYSSGMKARLAFSIVTSVDPDILLIDEALSVGDIGFVLKCRERMQALRSKGSTVVIVSHNMEAIREMCQRVIWLHEGEVRKDGEPGAVIEAYRVLRQDSVRKDLETKFGDKMIRKEYTEGLSLHNVRCVDGDGVERLVFKVGERFAMEVICDVREPLLNMGACLELTRNDGLLVLRSAVEGLSLPSGRSAITIDFDQQRLGRFPYEARVVLQAGDGRILAESSLFFAVEDDKHAYQAGYYQPVIWTAASTGRQADPTSIMKGA